MRWDVLGLWVVEGRVAVGQRDVEVAGTGKIGIHDKTIIILSA